MTEQIHQKNIFNQNPNGRIFNGLYPGMTGIDPNSIAAQVKALQASQEREFKKSIISLVIKKIFKLYLK